MVCQYHLNNEFSLPRGWNNSDSLCGCVSIADKQKDANDFGLISISQQVLWMCDCGDHRCYDLLLLLPAYL